MQKKSASTRLFENNWLEAATHVHPITPLVLWVPIISYLLLLATNEMSWIEMLPWAILGLLIWTFSEYMLHRLLFHYEAKGRFSKYMVYLFHGIHHDEPEDTTRLVMPPIPALAIASLFYFLFAALVGELYAKPLFSFFIIGYLGYDYIHYSVHHFACKNKILKFLKHHHMRHHHLVGDFNFGVSSPLWDIILRTLCVRK